MSHKIKALLVCSGMALALAACGSKEGAPTGQVVATVNGQEVTLQEVNAELAGVQLPQNADRKAVQRDALQRVIDRKLLVDEAKKQELDKTPEYVAQRMRVDETLLAQQLVRKQASAIAQPTQADLDGFMRDNPNMFAQREQLAVDQIRFRPPSDNSILKGLEAVHTQDGVAAALKERNVPFERGRSVIDTAQLPEAVVKKIADLPSTEPFVLPARGFLTINVIVARQAVPVPADQARQVATNGWREKQFNQMISGRMKTLKETAKITYQEGFAPAAGAAGATGAAPAAAGAAKPAAAAGTGG
ncbi:EpsD family peptidyl-prolyl cis-trans isomerase [Sphingomonas quercus]|uniref:peptidylprolyl isomerase n=1 Tax=Sphingomonas quercus TaxID=2842451 RepID=A0ABS6BIP3_9SPHN|nr:EpsD family peptidyl-prolyl cis-trans isomerase [Sphingomonas quercus]MBU3078178.1 EpsD family peptidyl-prolyl cis-trans isomerase [Sphingomonas quercus]